MKKGRKRLNKGGGEEICFAYKSRRPHEKAADLSYMADHCMCYNTLCTAIIRQGRG